MSKEQAEYRIQTENEECARPDGASAADSPPLAATPRRPALRYWGEKWRLGKRFIVPLLRGIYHTHFVDACGGGANITLLMPPTISGYRQTYNDSDSEVVTFFRVLRERPDALIRAIHYTPFSREVWERSYHDAADDDAADDLEVARRFYVRAWQSYGSTGLRRHNTGWQAEKTASRGPVISGWADTDNLYGVAERMRRVQIEHRDVCDLVPAYDSADTLFYVDPPYLLSTRSRRGYTEEMATEAEHTELARVLHEAEGAVAISGYPSDLYDALYTKRGWSKCTRSAQTGAAGETRTECLWLNPAAQERQAQQSLFT